MTTPEHDERARGGAAPRVTRQPPRRAGPIRSASMAFRPSDTTRGDGDATIDEGVRNAYKVYEEYMRQGDEAAGRYGQPHDRGRYEGDGYGYGPPRDPAAMAWQFWMGMMRTWLGVPAEMMGMYMPGYGRGGYGGHQGRHEHRRHEHHEHRHEKAPEAREHLRFEVLADRKVHVALDLPAAARLRTAHVGPMRRRDGSVGGVEARITWDASRAAPEVVIVAEGAEAGVYTGDVTLEGWTAALGTIQVTVDAAPGSTLP